MIRVDGIRPGGDRERTTVRRMDPPGSREGLHDIHIKNVSTEVADRFRGSFISRCTSQS